MLTKNIKSIIESKFKELLNSIDNEEVKELVRENTILTGGAIVSLLQNEEVNDFDFYFTNKETCLAVAKYFVGKWKETHKKSWFNPEVKDVNGRVKIFIASKGVISNEEVNEDEEGMGLDVLTDEIEYEVGVVDSGEETDYSDNLDQEDMRVNGKYKAKYKPTFLSSNAITLSNKEDKSIQLIIRFYGNVDEIHKNYDFVHCLSYWESKNRTLYLNPKSMQAILTKELIYQGSKYPLCSIIRTRKFIQRGWFCNAGQYLKMIFQCGELDLTNIGVLEDQLVGVDAAYFNQLIAFCREKQKEDENFVVDVPYIAELVEKIFQ